MKYLSLRSIALRLPALLLALGLWLSASPALHGQEQCRLGLHYQLGGSEGWGKAHPIVTAVLPHSPAYIAGLRAGDVLTAIDGVATQGLTSQQVSELLVRPSAQHLVTLARLGKGALTTLLRPDCKGTEELTERELAQAFAGYSLLDVTQQELRYPFTYHRAPDYAWSGAKTFGFAPSSEGSEPIDKPIYALVASLLKARGLRQVSSSPDLLVECFYSLQPSTDARRDATQPETSLRYISTADHLQVLPLLPEASLTGATYELQFSLQMTAPAHAGQLLWSCESRERLSEAMTLPDYAKDVLPVMLQAFPYISHTHPARYRYESLRYFYTGIRYDARDLSRIADVEPSSPAALAGLRAGDRILSINGKRLGISSVGKLSQAYQSFLGETFRLRATEELAPELRPWAKNSHAAVRKALERNPEETIFSYLFFFRPYINESKHTLLLFDIERQGKSYSLSIPPVLRDESVLIPE